MKIIKATHSGIEHDILVDDEDYPLLFRHKWYLLKSNDRLYAYASFYVGNGKDKQIQMTHMIVGNVNRVDHADNNSLNNQKYNLRPATHAQNEWNKAKQKTARGKPCTSQYKGVCLVNGRWKAHIKRNGVTHALGDFKNEDDAALAYNKKAVELSGEFVWVNPLTKVTSSKVEASE